MKKIIVMAILAMGFVSYSSAQTTPAKKEEAKPTVTKVESTDNTGATKAEVTSEDTKKACDKSKCSKDKACCKDKKAETTDAANNGTVVEEKKECTKGERTCCKDKKKS